MNCVIQLHLKLMYFSMLIWHSSVRLNANVVRLSLKAFPRKILHL